MPYRCQSTVCIVCSKSSNTSCRNCQGHHCRAHLIDGTCAGCVGTLWQIERRQVATATTVYGVLAIPAFVLGLSLGALLAPAVAAYLALGHVGRRSFRSLVRRKLARRKLSPSSVPQPKQLPAPVEGFGDGSSRPRPHRTMYHRRPARTVFMHGGYVL